MSTYIYNEKKKIVKEFYTSPKIEKAVETLLLSNENLVYSETHEGYSLDIVDKNKSHYILEAFRFINNVCNRYSECADCPLYIHAVTGTIICREKRCYLKTNAAHLSGSKILELLEEENAGHADTIQKMV